MMANVGLKARYFFFVALGHHQIIFKNECTLEWSDIGSFVCLVF